MPTSDREVVTALAQAICQRVGEPRYNLWFHNRTKFTWDDSQLTVGVPNHFYQEWMHKTFADDLAAAAQDVLGRSMRVAFAIDPELFQAARRAEAEAREVRPAPSGTNPTRQRGDGPLAGASGLCGAEGSPPPATTPASTRQEAASEKSSAVKPRTRRWHHLHEFIVGSCNRVAHASAVSVVEDPGQDANPLVLHGPVGTGKTHLLEGIYAGLRKGRPEWRVCFVTAEDFTNRFVQAMRFGKLSAFRKQFRECDALLMDDVHFLATKRATQEEFLHTLDALHADGRQVVLTCDCHPRLEEQFLPELTDRLLGGAVWGLTPPDTDTRLQLLRVKSARPGQAPLGDDVLRYLAEQLRGNVRELEGAVHSIHHYSRVAGRKVDLALVREALGELLRHSVRVVQMPDVDRVVCAVLQLEAGSLQAKQRAWKFSHPRMLAMYLARKHTAATYTEVGQHFGGRSHSTAVAAEKKVRQWLQDDGMLNLGERQVRVRDVMERAERDLLR